MCPWGGLEGLTPSETSQFSNRNWTAFGFQQDNVKFYVKFLFTRFALRCLYWDDPNNLPFFPIRCKMLGLSSLYHRRIVFDSIFIFDLLTGKIRCSELLQEVSFNVNPHRTRNASLLYCRAHRTIYGFNAPLKRCLRNFSKFNEVFDFNLSRSQFRNRIIVE
jgi:hypothetical protein